LSRWEGQSTSRESLWGQAQSTSRQVDQSGSRGAGYWAVQRSSS
jgi:hypothetical protein